jgi:paraquat-inducible protein A
LVQRIPGELLGSNAKCARCGTRLRRFIPDSRSRTLALALAALALYAPANIYPVMIMDLLGRHSENTVWSGVVSLCQDGMYFIAGIVFVASILIPVLKLLGLFFLALGGGPKNPRRAALIYKIICVAGPWAMLDVFLLAIAVALIKFGKFGHVTAGPGIIWFAAVVVLTLFASASFDPRLLWEEGRP